MLKLTLRSIPVLLVVIFLIKPALPAHAATSVSCDVGDLITAIENANTNGGDTLNLATDCDYVLTDVYGDETGLPTIATPVIINGNGATIERSTIGGTPAFRIFTVNSSGKLTLDNLTIAHGSGTQGGGIFNNSGSVTITRSTFSQNSVSASGGAIVSSKASTTITNSTFSQNSAGSGGAINIQSNATLTITNSTFSQNSASSGGGLYINYLTTLVMNNSIFANNPGGDCVTDSTSLTVSHSLILGGATCYATNGVNGNIVGQDPKLDAVTGSPAYFPLLADSPAINKGDNNLIPGGITTDQSGNDRIINSMVDMGAFEYDPEVPTATNTPTTTPTTTPTSTETTTTTPTSTETTTPTQTETTTTTPTQTETTTTTPTPTVTETTTTTPTPTETTTVTTTPTPTETTTITNTPTTTPTPTETTTVTTTPTLTPTPTRPPVVAPAATNRPAEVFLCDDLGKQTASAMTAFGSISNVTLDHVTFGNVFCRIIVRDDIVITSLAEIGVEQVLNLGVVQAVDLFGLLPNGTSVVPFISPMYICLRGSGDAIFLSAADVARTPMWLPISPNSPAGYACANIPVSGTVILVRTKTGNAPPPVQPTSSSTILTNCQVTTINAPLNLRMDPEINAVVLAQLPYDLTLTATARILGWYRVIYLNGQGWVSADFVRTVGICD